MKIIHLFFLLILASAPSFAQSTYTPYTFITLAGTANSSGSADGQGSAARFNQPSGLAVDSAGNVYVADSANHTLRKITPTGVVTTLAGVVGSSGRTDGTGSGAQFGYPSGVAVDGAGNVYVAEWDNHALRKVTPAGKVTTLAGQNDSAAHFNHPYGIAVDANGNVYVADSDNHTLRKVTPKGLVTTLAGLAGNSGGADGTGSAARFYAPVDVAVDSLGYLYVADLFNHTIRKVTPAGVVTTLVGRAEGDSNPDGRVGFVVL